MLSSVSVCAGSCARSLMRSSCGLYEQVMPASVCQVTQLPFAETVPGRTPSAVSSQSQSAPVSAAPAAPLFVPSADGSEAKIASAAA